MIFFANAQGNITRVIPDSVYQNSHRSSEVVLVAPFSKNVSVGVAFNLPNGMRTSLNFAQPNMGEIDLTDIMDGNGTGYNAWRCLLEQTVTEYAGEVGVQFFIYNGYNVNGNLNLEILATYQSTFNVIKGVSYIPPVVDEDSDVPIYNQIMAYLSMLQASGEGGTYEPIISTEPAIADGIEYPVTIRPDRTAYVLIPFNAGGGGSGGGESTSGGTAGVAYALSTDGTYAICTGIGTATATDIVLASTYQGVPVTTIGEGAFSGSNITSITISGNITAIMDDAFANCASLLSINVATNNTAYKQINGVLYSEYETALIKYPDNKSGATLTLPSTLTEIKPYAINNTALTLIDATACEVVPSLGGNNFTVKNSDLKIKVPYDLYSTWVAREDWKNYSNIIISNGLDEGATPTLTYSIADGVATCTGIGSTSVGANIVISSVYNGVPVTKIGESAFKLSSIVSVTIPDSVTIIEKDAFRACENLTSVIIPDSVTTIGGAVFAGCSALTSVSIGSGLTSIGDYAFSICPALANITVDSNNAAYKSVNGDLYNKSGTTLIKYAVGKTETIFSAPNSVTAVGADAIAEAINLTSIYFTSGVIEIGADAFFNCSNLATLAFINNTEVPSLGADALYGTNSSLLIYVPSHLLTAWKSEADWSAYASQIKSYTTSLSYKLSDDGTYAICTGNSGTAVNVAISPSFKGVPVTMIGDGAFKNNSYMTSVVIPSSVTSIGEGVFQYCNKLTSVTIPNSVTSIGDYAFWSCSALTSVVIGSSATSIGWNSFFGCDSLASITVVEGNENYKSIDGNLYSYDGTVLIQYAIGKTGTTFVIPSSVTSIGDYAFYDCSSLTSVEIGDSVASIGEGAFQNCSNLTTINATACKRVPTLAVRAFNNTALTTIVVPDDLYDDWVSATNWAEYSDKIKKASEYEAQ